MTSASQHLGRVCERRGSSWGVGSGRLSEDVPGKHRGGGQRVGRSSGGEAGLWKAGGRELALTRSKSPRTSQGDGWGAGRNWGPLCVSPHSASSLQAGGQQIVALWPHPARCLFCVFCFTRGHPWRLLCCPTQGLCQGRRPLGPSAEGA